MNQDLSRKATIAKEDKIDFQDEKKSQTQQNTKLDFFILVVYKQHSSKSHLTLEAF